MFLVSLGRPGNKTVKLLQYQQTQPHLVPVEGRERSAEVRVLVVVEETLQLGLRLPGPPHAEVVTRRGQQV